MSQQVLERPTSVNNAEMASKQFPPLTAHDRCDAPTFKMVGEKRSVGNCGAQAQVRAVLPSGNDLLFCGHCLGQQTVGKRTDGTKSHEFATRRAKLEAAGAVLDVSNYLQLSGGTADARTSKQGF